MYSVNYLDEQGRICDYDTYNSYEDAIVSAQLRLASAYCSAEIRGEYGELLATV